MNFFQRTRRWCGLLLLLAAPLYAQELTPVSSVAVPELAPAEFVFGLGSTGTDLLLLTSRSFYSSPLYAGGSTSFTDTGITMAGLGITINATSLALSNPGDPNQMYITGGGGLVGNFLYTLQFQPAPSTSSVSLSSAFPGRPQGMAVDGTGAVYLSRPVVGSESPSGGIYKITSAQNVSLELNFGLSGPGLLNTPGAMALGPDGLLYVLDTGDERVVSFDTEGVFQSAFSLNAPVESRALAIANDGRLFTLNSAGGGDIYDIFTGTQVGSLADTGDVGFNPGGKPALWIEGDYLYAIGAAGANVQIYAVPEPTTTALLAGMAAFLACKRPRKR